jgi:hypothetical protein
MTRVRKLSLALALFALQVACASPSLSGEETVNRSIGALLVTHDQMNRHEGGPTAFAGKKLYQEFIRAYESDIKELPEEERFRFLWAAMWHLGFDGHLMEEFQQLVLADCGDLFAERLVSYVKAESELQRNKTRLYLSEKVLAGMTMARDQQPASKAK